MGRPSKKANISKEEFEKLCAMQCTELEICAWFDVIEDTLNSWCKDTYEGKTFSEVFKIKREKGKISLRRSQFNLAKTNPTMGIWLGKQYLGQKDKQEEESQAEAIQIMLKSLIEMNKATSQAMPNRNIEDLE